MVKRYKGLDADVTVQAGAHAGLPDAEFEAAGATIDQGAEEAVRSADVILSVRRLPQDSFKGGRSTEALRRVGVSR